VKSNVIDVETGWKVDLVCRRSGDFARSEFARRRSADILGVRVFVASAEDTILAKLVWARDAGSERQVEDALGIVQACGDDLDRAYVERWAQRLGVEALWRRIDGA